MLVIGIFLQKFRSDGAMVAFTSFKSD